MVIESEMIIKPTIMVFSQQYTHLLHGSISDLSAFSCELIQVSSVKETNVTAVISEPCLWHGLDSWKDEFYSFLSAVGGPTSPATFVKDARREDQI